MRRLVCESLADPKSRTLALELLRSYMASDISCYIKTVAGYLRGRSVMVDEADELLVSPGHLLSWMEAGGTVWMDCDDVSMCAAVLLGAVGLPVRFKAIEPRPDGSATHVFAEYWYAERWNPFDISACVLPVTDKPFVTMEV